MGVGKLHKFTANHVHEACNYFRLADGDADITDGRTTTAPSSLFDIERVAAEANYIFFSKPRARIHRKKSRKNGMCILDYRGGKPVVGEPMLCTSV